MLDQSFRVVTQIAARWREIYLCLFDNFCCWFNYFCIEQIHGMLLQQEAETQGVWWHRGICGKAAVSPIQYKAGHTVIGEFHQWPIGNCSKTRHDRLGSCNTRRLSTMFCEKCPNTTYMYFWYPITTHCIACKACERPLVPKTTELNPIILGIFTPTETMYTEWDGVQHSQPQWVSLLLCSR